MKAESVEGVIDVGSIESTLSVHPTVFDILTKPVSDNGLRGDTLAQDSVSGPTKSSVSAVSGIRSEAATGWQAVPHLSSRGQPSGVAPLTQKTDLLAGTLFTANS